MKDSPVQGPSDISYGPKNDQSDPVSIGTNIKTRYDVLQESLQFLEVVAALVSTEDKSWIGIADAARGVHDEGYVGHRWGGLARFFDGSWCKCKSIHLRESITQLQQINIDNNSKNDYNYKLSNGTLINSNYLSVW